MLRSLLGAILFAVLFGALYLVRARDDKGRFGPASAQAVALGLVCLLMLAGGLVFTAALD